MDKIKKQNFFSFVAIDRFGEIRWLSEVDGILATDKAEVIGTHVTEWMDKRSHLAFVTEVGRTLITGSSEPKIIKVLKDGKSKDFYVSWFRAKGCGEVAIFIMAQEVIVVKMSEGEAEYLAHLATGMSNEEIAEAMEVSPKTASRTYDRLCEKTGSANLSQLIRFAVDIVS